MINHTPTAALLHYTKPRTRKSWRSVLNHIQSGNTSVTNQRQAAIHCTLPGPKPSTDFSQLHRTTKSTKIDISKKKLITTTKFQTNPETVHTRFLTQLDELLDTMFCARGQPQD